MIFILEIAPFIVALLITLHYFPISRAHLIDQGLKIFLAGGWFLTFLVIPGVQIWSFISLFSWILCFYGVLLILRVKNYPWLLSSSVACLSVLIGSVVYELPIFYLMINDFSELFFSFNYLLFLSRVTISIILLLHLLIKNGFKPSKKVQFCLMLYAGFYPVYMIYPRIWGWIPRAVTIALFLTVAAALPNYREKPGFSSLDSHSSKT